MAKQTTVYKRCECPDQKRPKKGGCKHSWSYNYTNSKGNRTRGSVPNSVGLSEAQAQSILEDIDAGVAPRVTEARVTFETWAADWFSRRRAKETSVEKYEIAIRVHLNPRWGRERLNAIEKRHVEAWVKEIEANDEIAGSTGDGHWKVFQMIMKDALQNGKITTNPTYGVDGPYVGQSTSYVFTPEECWAIYDEFPERYRVIPMIGFACGTRQAEAFAVCEDVVDWDRQLLTVRRQVLTTKETRYKRLLVERLKTSPRLNSKVVPAPSYLLEALAEHSTRHPPRTAETVLWEHRKQIADCERGSARAYFWTPRNNLMSRNYFNDDLWKPTLLKLGIKDKDGNLPTFHDLRHTFISTCLQNGIPEHTVAAWVGDTVEEIRRTYSHLLKDHGETHGALAAGLTARPKTPSVLAVA
ncbi:tyrosine-type recombinase/integrase [Streptomyces sp. NPDC004435]|uniref:tyrosine-type recombinase/integrase n=1 Tax=Streptomyces sp. NPDC004435 TaxID=3364701 RepID=UPI0036830A76